MRKKGGTASVRGSEDEWFVAALSYVWILCLYPFLFKKKSPFIQFHAKQGLALFVIEVLSTALLFFSWIIIIPCLIVSFMGVVQCYRGKYWTLPFIGEWVKKINV